MYGQSRPVLSAVWGHRDRVWVEGYVGSSPVQYLDSNWKQNPCTAYQPGDPISQIVMGPRREDTFCLIVRSIICKRRLLFCGRRGT